MTARDAWRNAGLEIVRLPSGFLVRGVRPSPSEITRRQLFPAELRRKVLEAAGDDNKQPDLTDDTVAALWVEQRRVTAAAFVRGIWDEESGEWDPLTITALDLNEGFFHPDDVEALDDLVLGARTPDMITAYSELDLGLTTAEEALAIAEREAGDTVDGWSQFRDWLRRSTGSSPGGDVAPAPLRVVGDNRAARRSRSKRRPVATPDDVEGRRASGG